MLIRIRVRPDPRRLPLRFQAVILLRITLILDKRPEVAGPGIHGQGLGGSQLVGVPQNPVRVLGIAVFHRVADSLHAEIEEHMPLRAVAVIQHPDRLHHLVAFGRDGNAARADVMAPLAEEGPLPLPQHRIRSPRQLGAGVRGRKQWLPGADARPGIPDGGAAAPRQNAGVQ
ncbi:hypothetical protein D3C75_913380 [compost metagenome]